MIALTRRQLLRWLAGLGAWLPASLLPAVPADEEVEPGPELRALGPWLDTLLPADATPSATQLQVDASIIFLAGSSRPLQRLLTVGCAWLDQQAQARGAADFARLDPSAREAIVQAAERSPGSSLPRAFFEQVRSLAFYEYYARPEAWQGLGYAGPPQPRGFPDHTQPPAMYRS